MNVFQILIVIVLISAVFAQRQVRTCNGGDSASVGMKIFMADCPIDDDDFPIYDCGEANSGGTWMNCELIPENDVANVPGALNAKNTIEGNCDDEDYSNGVFLLITSEGNHSDQLCLTAIKHDSETSLNNFCNNLDDSSLYHAIYNSKGMCEEPEWSSAIEYGRIIFGETDSYTMGHTYFFQKSQSYREANLIRALTNNPEEDDFDFDFGTLEPISDTSDDEE